MPYGDLAFFSAEYPLESKSLRIAGRVDLFRTLAVNSVAITDYKSGSAVDLNGRVDADTTLQLRLYALAILEAVPEASVQLEVIGRKGAANVCFGDREADETRRWLESHTSGLVSGSVVEPLDLARVGPQCRTCSIRPACTRYTNDIPQLWRESELGFPLPLDTAGAIDGATRTDESVWALRVRELSGRTVKLHRLVLSDGLEALKEQRLLWFFNLASSDVIRPNGCWRHPNNFHELPSDPREHRAWRLQMYRPAS